MARDSSSAKKDGSDDDEGRRLTVHWFRNTDLRLHDNPALCRSVELSRGGGKQVGGKTQTSRTTSLGSMLPVFVFDTTRTFGSDYTQHGLTSRAKTNTTSN